MLCMPTIIKMSRCLKASRIFSTKRAQAIPRHPRGTKPWPSDFTSILASFFLGCTGVGADTASSCSLAGFHPHVRARFGWVVYILCSPGWISIPCHLPIPVWMSTSNLSLDGNLDRRTMSRTSLLRTWTSSAHPDVRTATLRVKEGCLLGVSVYPNFRYNASGGGGRGKAMLVEGDAKVLAYQVRFDADELYIPSLNTQTTKILGLPLPPFLSIAIEPLSLEGSVDVETGRVDLDFDAEFKFTMGSFYAAPPLRVTTTLTTEDSQGILRKGRGKRRNQEGSCKLAGVARVPKVNDGFLDTFLMLPTDALAELEAELLLD